MLDDRKLLVTLTAIAVAGVLGLFIYSMTLEPLALDIGEIDRSHIGDTVVTSGTVARARPLSGDSMSVVLIDVGTYASISVFMPSDGETDEIMPGAVLEVRGEVVLYQDELEITVAKPEHVRVLSSSPSVELALGTVMGSVETFDGMNVTTRGSVTDMAALYSNGTLVGTSFCITDTEGNVTYAMDCMCFGRDLTGSFSDWDDVTVSGTVSFYENRASWQIIVEVISPAARA